MTGIICYCSAIIQRSAPSGPQAISYPPPPEANDDNLSPQPALKLILGYHGSH